MTSTAAAGVVIGSNLGLVLEDAHLRLKQLTPYLIIISWTRDAAMCVSTQKNIF